MAELKLRVYQISVRDLERLLEKFPVFASAELSEEAREQGAFENTGTKTGWYYTRNKAENGWVVYVGFYGGLISYSPANSDTGLRIGLQVWYNEESAVVKSEREEKRKAIIWDKNTKNKKGLVGKAPVVTFGGIDYIWMNKEDCKAGVAKTMDLVSLKLIARAKQFGAADGDNNYDRADNLIGQSEDVALAGCTDEERSMIVPVVMTSADNFMTAVPQLAQVEKKEAGWQNVSENIPSVADGKVDGKQ